MDIENKTKEYLKYVDDVAKIITKDNINKIICYIKQIPLLCKLDLESKKK